MKLYKLLRARKILGDHMHEQLPAPLAYKIMKFIKASENEGAFYNEKFNEIVNRYGEKNHDGKSEPNDGKLHIDKSRAPQCEQEINELNEMEVDTPNIIFSISELDVLRFSVSDLFVLDDFISEEGCNGI